MVPIVAEKREEVAALCRHYGVRQLDLFGSAARGHDFTDQSDIDLLIEYEPDRPPSWGPLFELRDALAALFGRDVDFVMAGAVRNPYLRASIERSREPLYGA
ncbi:nucleotidyltransferase family protein [Lichenibacterium dinghuense]|uniref:nucleotidyltransferase family protein n=1 Tax=Lichenibacterium dinghuense TaxID=2895977 RepID=UPI001F02A402|nr:nucleotidyltransferase domain-containing protein [Lichenibacterium sp. 6Y81]